MIRTFIPLLLALAAMSDFMVDAVPAFAQQAPSWQADPERGEELSRKRTEFNYQEAKVPAFSLPPIFRSTEAATPSSQNQNRWLEERRPELLHAFRDHVYGWRPETNYSQRVEAIETRRGVLDGRADAYELKMDIVIGNDSFAFPFVVFLPTSPEKSVAENSVAESNASKRSHPAVVFINNRSALSIDEASKADSFWQVNQLIASGFATASFFTSDVDPDDKDGYERGIRSFFKNAAPPAEAESSTDARSPWGSLSAWGFAASRVADHLRSIESVDEEKISVVGHSRGGKTALWAAAEDDRFFAAHSNESGCGGAAISRRRYGETVKRITSSFPHWFTDKFATYGDNEDQLPVDQHQLIALVAPRGVYVASAADDLWADPKGEYLSIVAARPAYAVFAKESIDTKKMPPLDQPVIVGPTGYHIRPGGHGLLPIDWERFIDFLKTIK